MKTLKQILMRCCMFAAAASATMGICAQDKAPLQYVDAQDLRIINKGWDNTLRKYTRIPAYLEDSVRSTLWERSQCSSGIAVRFATDSRRVGVKYQLLWNTHMLHMADTDTTSAFPNIRLIRLFISFQILLCHKYFS